MNKRIISISASLLTLSVSGALCYWAAPEIFSGAFVKASVAEKEEPVPVEHPNEHLKADFIKIASYYKKTQLSFIQTITKYSGEDFSKARERSTNTIYRGEDFYLSEGAHQIMMCNARVSLLIDKPNGVIYMDSAWDMNALMPYTNAISDLLGSFDEIKKKEMDQGLVEYSIPSNQKGVDYTLLTADLRSGQIKKMEVFGQRSLADGEEEKGKIVVDYTDYSLSPALPKEKRNESHYIRRKGKLLKGSKAYQGFKVISKNTIYEPSSNKSNKN